MKKTASIFLLLALLLSGIACAQESKVKKPDFLQYVNSSWVDSTMKTMTPDERIGQLIMVAAYSNREKNHKKEIMELIEEHKIGGLIFFQGNPASQIELMNDYQQASEVPLLGAIDAEWGLGMRLDNTISYPFQMALGAVQDDSLIYKMGEEIALQLQHTGLHMNFAPVVDVNNNPNNPVINFRSFGEDKKNVAEKAIAYMKGMQSKKLLTTAKHFPGHGDTDTDSHFALPVIGHSRGRLDSLELFPFREIIKAGVGGVMVAHLNIPALDSSGVPSTLSKPIITDLLKGELGFEGLIVTDAMNMKGVTKGNEPGVVDKDAILAGNDLLEFTEDVPRAISEIQKAIRQGLVSQNEIDDRVRKILAIKQWVGLNEYKPLSSTNIITELNTPKAKLLNRQLIEASMTVLNNDRDLLPVKNLDSIKFASVSFGAENLTHFQKCLSQYTEFAHFQLPLRATEAEVRAVEKELKKYDMVVAGIHDDSKNPRNTNKFSGTAQHLISEIGQAENSIIVFFKNPYVLNKLAAIEEADALIVAYQDNQLTQEVAPQVIFGGIGANGRLPVSIGEKYKVGDGIEVKGEIRLGYTIPEAVEMDSDILVNGIDSLMQQAIDMKATPGGVVLVARKGKVIFNKAYGEHRYSDTIKVKTTDLYDLASVTKISATMAALMKLHDQDKFHLDATLADYLPKFRRSNKKDIPFYDILTHQARFQPWIPFWKNTLRKNGSYRWWTFKKDSSARYPIKVAENMFLNRNYPDKIYKAIRKSPLLETKEYVYSDFFFILAPEVVENMIDRSFPEFLEENFYSPLGASSLMYNPMKKYPLNKIVPTEHDYNFRHKPIHGDVHDEGAIMLGGVSGHAGLFGNANDLAKLLQMYLNKGEYGGTRYLQKETLEEFTKVTFPEGQNPRALGFDKPRYNEEGISRNTAQDASAESFGHTGFTGIMVWMDPKVDLLYIFLANRVSPTRENHRLYDLNTRTNIHQVLYNAIDG